MSFLWLLEIQILTIRDLVAFTLIVLISSFFQVNIGILIWNVFNILHGLRDQINGGFYHLVIDGNDRYQHDICIIAAPCFADV